MTALTVQPIEGQVRPARRRTSSGREGAPPPLLLVPLAPATETIQVVTAHQIGVGAEMVWHSYLRLYTEM